MKVFFEALKSFVGKPFTLNYFLKRPKVRVPEGFRGAFSWDRKKCVWCGLCGKNCPAGAISVDGRKKKYHFNQGRCIFCGRCAEVCPKKAIALTKNYALAETDRKNLEKDLK